MTYSDLKKEFGDKYIPYSRLLFTKEWQSKREEIIMRDSNKCQICGVHCADDYLLKLFGSNVYLVPSTVEEVINENVLGLSSKLKLVEMSNPMFAHIHHKFYIKDKLPWQYENEDLILYCHICHLNIHISEQIKVYVDSSKTKEVSMTKCSKCYGTGHLPQYNHVQNGVCFKCMGSCYEEWK